MSSGDPDSAPDELHARIAEALDAWERGGTEALEQVCARHPDHAAVLRQRVHGLAALGLLDEVGANDAPPQRLGDFVPLRRLGGGGMGVVYLARQESLGREVALKLIRPDQLHLPGARERFRREVETVARLQHPGIVPVYAVGEERGVPFLAMERVDGRNLADVVAALEGRDPGALTGADLARAVREDAGEPSWVFQGSYADACVRLVRQAAEALEHAHRRGVTHRDLKPSNLMVTPDGRALLLDFGLSSFEGSSKITRTGSQLGSLAYMAPEHLRTGRPSADARGDVYGLGVTLYELLALRSPFARDSSEETRLAVLSGDPQRLREVNGGVSWELETVCAKAMDVDPARRYATAADFARDLENVLEQRPIEARRAGAWLRARRWVQRHPTAAVSALAGVLVLVVGPMVFALQQVRARDRLQLALDETEAQRQRATQLAGELRLQRDEAQAQGARAEENLDAALSAVDVMLTRVGERDLRQVPRMDEVRRGLLEDALAFYNDLLAQRAGEATSLDELELRFKLATLEMEFGEDAAAEERLAELLGRIDRAAEAGLPAEPLEYLTGRVLNALAGLHYGVAQSPDALAEFRASARILQECATGPHATSGHRATAALALANLGQALWQAEVPREQVLEVYDAARELRALLLGENSEHVDQQVELAFVDGMRARCLLALGRKDEAYAAVDQAEQGLRAVLAAPLGGRVVRSRIVATANGLTWSMDHSGDTAQALALFEDVLPISEGLVRDFPEIDDYLQENMVLAINLAGGLSDNPDGTPPDPARLARARDILRRTLVEMDRQVQCGNDVAGLVLMGGTARSCLAEVQLDLNEPADAMLQADRAIDELQGLSLEGPGGTARRELARSVGSATITRATVLAHDGAHAQALEDLRRVGPSQAGDARSEYELAKAWMLCGAAVERDAALPADAAAAALDECYGSALAALSRAVDAGWTNAVCLRRDALWETVRELPEFDALLGRLAPQR